ncbi:cold shock domain-containing protein [Azospirillum sp. INR13]|uniref:cold shock domain-containing protein n=1 Tax=Azospirillum sp. INR13 TaxID=2596919 RepID=UPI0018925AA4|nr:cold shock domain-containing protein [Azospirillum sp. INR13]
MSDQERSATQLEGRVKWFSQDKGYGFIVGDDGVDRYFAVQDIRGVYLPSNGDFVEFNHEMTRKGPRAVGVELVARVAKEPGLGRVCCQSCGKAMVPRVVNRLEIGTLAAFASETVAAFSRNLQTGSRSGCKCG